MKSYWVEDVMRGERKGVQASACITVYRSRDAGNSVMEPFHLLSRGGVKFNKKRFISDVKLFNVCILHLTCNGLPSPCHCQHPKISDKEKKPQYSANELPPELDFFRYAKGGPGVKRKTPHENDQDVVKSTGDNSEGDDYKNAQSPRGKRRKLETDMLTTPKSSEQRVTSKGRNIPVPIDSFQMLKDRYNCSSLVLFNLERNGWKSPTGIQAHAIPMLMEVCSVFHLRHGIID